MNSFEAYKMFVTLKLHFTSEKYDYFQYQGKSSRIRVDAFQKRHDIHFFKKIADKRDPQGLIVSNIVYRDVTWVGDFVSEEGEETHKKWLRYTNSLSYNATQEIKSLTPDFKSFFMVHKGQHPALMKMQKRQQISLETLIILNDILGFFPYWEEKISDPIVWPSLRDKCIKYKPFLKYDYIKIKKLVKEIMSSENDAK
jgi:hypothetical protein